MLNFAVKRALISLYIELATTQNIRGCIMYRIETTDPITGITLERLINMPFVIQNDKDDSLVIYFESEHNRDLYLENPDRHQLEHYRRTQ